MNESCSFPPHHPHIEIMIEVSCLHNDHLFSTFRVKFVKGTKERKEADVPEEKAKRKRTP